MMTTTKKSPKAPSLSHYTQTEWSPHLINGISGVGVYYWDFCSPFFGSGFSSRMRIPPPSTIFFKVKLSFPELSLDDILHRTPHGHLHDYPFFLSG